MKVPLRCPAPVRPEDLGDWWIGDLSESDAAAVEEHLLACSVCSFRAERLGALLRALKDEPASGGEDANA